MFRARVAATYLEPNVNPRQYDLHLADFDLTFSRPGTLGHLRETHTVTLDATIVRNGESWRLLRPVIQFDLHINGRQIPVPECLHVEWFAMVLADPDGLAAVEAAVGFKHLGRRLDLTA